MVTIIQNKYGHLCVWRGGKHIFAKGRDSFIDYEGNECELLFDFQEDIDEILRPFNRQEIFRLDSGFFIHTENFDETKFDNDGTS